MGLATPCQARECRTAIPSQSAPVQRDMRDAPTGDRHAFITDQCSSIIEPQRYFAHLGQADDGKIRKQRNPAIARQRMIGPCRYWSGNQTSTVPGAAVHTVFRQEERANKQHSGIQHDRSQHAFHRGVTVASTPILRPTRNAHAQGSGAAVNG